MVGTEINTAMYIVTFLKMTKILLDSRASVTVQREVILTVINNKTATSAHICKQLFSHVTKPAITGEDTDEIDKHKGNLSLFQCLYRYVCTFSVAMGNIR